MACRHIHSNRLKDANKFVIFIIMHCLHSRYQKADKNYKKISVLKH